MFTAVRAKLSLIFFFIGLAVCITSSAGYSIQYLLPSYQFGFMQVLSPWFWFGFALCLVSILEGLNRDKEGIFFIKAFIVAMLIWNIPTLLLAHLYPHDAYMHTFRAIPIMLSGHVPSASETLPMTFAYYPASFPGYFILLSSIFQITNIAPLEFARYYPLLCSAVTFPAIWLFFKTFLPSKNYRWALLIAILANVYMQLHVGSHSLGLVAGLLMLVALEKEGWCWKVTAALLFVYITISHPTTAFIVLSAAGLAWLLRLLLVRDRKILLEPVPFFIIGWIAWARLFAVPFWERLAGLVVTELAAAEGPTVLAAGIPVVDIAIAEVWRRLYGAFSLGTLIRLIAMGIFVLGSVYYLARQRLNKANHNHRLLITYTAFLIAPVVLTLLDVISLSADPLHQRYFLFFVLIASILLVRLAEGIRHPLRKNAFLIAVVFVALFNFTTFYYQSSRFTTSDETISASLFVNRNTSAQVMGGHLVPDLADPERSAQLRCSQFDWLYPRPLSSYTIPSVIVFDDHDRIGYQIRYGVEKYDFYVREVEQETDFDKVYSNKRYDIYWFPGDGG